MKLSIIVPVYNMASDNKLSFCLDSLFNQTISDYEVIAVDDCSTDNSLEILREYEAKHPWNMTVIISEKNGHQGAAKNKGLRVAKGEWIGFVDSDDFVAPDMYEKLLFRAEETGADVVGCDMQIVYGHSFEGGQTVASSRDAQVGELNLSQKQSLVLDGGSLCTKIYKRDRIIGDGLYFPENIFYEDNAMSNSYLVMAKHFEYVKEPLYYYYQHSTSTVHTVTKRRCEDRCVASRIMMEEAKNRGYYEELKEELDYKFIMLFYLNTLFSYVREGDSLDIKFIKCLGKELVATVPDFENNKYYKERINAEEKKLTRMQIKSTGKFLIYYKLLTLYRKIRYGKRN